MTEIRRVFFFRFIIVFEVMIMDDGIKIAYFPNGIVVSIYGDLDSAHVLAYKSKIVAEMAHRHPTDFLWDFTHLSFLDSSGIGLMLGRYNDIRAVGGRIGVMGLKNSTRKILKLTGLDSIMEEYQSVNDFKKKGTYSYE